jgi:hypothetical protein
MNNMLERYYEITTWEKLKVIQLKRKNIKIVRIIIKIMEYDVKISHVIFRVFSVA